MATMSTFMAIRTRLGQRLRWRPQLSRQPFISPLLDDHCASHKPGSSSSAIFLLKDYKAEVLLQPATSVSHQLGSVNHFCTQAELDAITFEKVCEETLHSLLEELEELIEDNSAPPDSDISYSSGILTLQLGNHGTYVINRQTPNQQIWFSSPLSGPKRYDFVNKCWIYKHDGVSMHDLLSKELKNIFNRSVDLTRCLHSGRQL